MGTLLPALFMLVGCAHKQCLAYGTPDTTVESLLGAAALQNGEIVVVGAPAPTGLANSTLLAPNGQKAFIQLPNHCGEIDVASGAFTEVPCAVATYGDDNVLYTIDARSDGDYVAGHFIGSGCVGFTVTAGTGVAACNTGVSEFPLGGLAKITPWEDADFAPIAASRYAAGVFYASGPASPPAHVVRVARAADGSWSFENTLQVDTVEVFSMGPTRALAWSGSAASIFDRDAATGKWVTTSLALAGTVVDAQANLVLSIETGVSDPYGQGVGTSVAHLYDCTTPCTEIASAPAGTFTSRSTCVEDLP